MIIHSVEKLGNNQVKVNGSVVQITSPTWSKHYDIMYFMDGYKTSNNFSYIGYHFVHVMHNEEGFLVQANGGSTEKFHFIFFDAWPNQANHSKSDIRFKHFKTESDMHNYWTGWRVGAQSSQKISGHHNAVWWAKIAEFICSQLNQTEEAWTWRFKSLADMEAGGYLNCKLFARKWNETLLGCQMDSYLWGKFKDLLKTTIVGYIEHNKKIDKDKERNHVLRLEGLIVSEDTFERAARAASVMSFQKTSLLPIPLREEQEILYRTSISLNEDYEKLLKLDHMIRYCLAVGETSQNLPERLTIVSQVLSNFMRTMQNETDLDKLAARKEVETGQVKANEAQSKVSVEEILNLNSLIKNLHENISLKRMEVLKGIHRVKEAREKASWESTNLSISEANKVEEEANKIRADYLDNQLEKELIHYSCNSQKYKQNQMLFEETLLHLQEVAIKEQMEANKIHMEIWKAERWNIVEAQKEVIRTLMSPNKYSVQCKLKEMGILKKWDTIVTREIGNKVAIMVYQGTYYNSQSVKSQMKSCGLDFSLLLQGTGIEDLKIREQPIAETILLESAETKFGTMWAKETSIVSSSRESLSRQSETMPPSCSQQ